MSKTGRHYPEPLNTVFSEMAGDFDVPPYTLELYMAGCFVLDLAPTTASQTERDQIRRQLQKLEFTHPGLPAIKTVQQQQLELDKA